MVKHRGVAAVACAALATLAASCANVLGLGNFENVCSDGSLVTDHAACPAPTGGGSGGAGGSGLGGNGGGGAGGGGGSGGCGGAGCPAGEAIWALGFGDALPQQGAAIAADADGNVLVAGTFQGTVELGGPTMTSAGGDDLFVAKLDGDGSHLSSKRFGDSNIQRATALAVDSDGNVGLGGEFTGTLGLGGPLLQTAGGLDAFVTKLGPDLVHLWSKSFGGGGTQSVRGVAFAGADLVVAGAFAHELDLGSGPQAGSGSFVVRLDANGGILWAKTFGATGAAAAAAVAIDSAGRAIVAGTFAGTVDFGAGPLTSDGGSDLFVVAIDAQGATAWSKGYGDAADQGAVAVATDSAGGIFLCGSFAGAINFGLGTIQSHGGTDAFVVKLDSSGHEQWHRQGGDAADQAATALAVDGDGAVLVTGGFAGSIDFGGELVTSTGGQDVFLAKLDAVGAPLGIRSAGDASTELRALAMAADPGGHALITGLFDGALTFDPLPALVGAGQTDGFVAKLSP
jgi:hypothetical protein